MISIEVVIVIYLSQKKTNTNLNFKNMDQGDFIFSPELAKELQEECLVKVLGVTKKGKVEGDSIILQACGFIESMQNGIQNAIIRIEDEYPDYELITLDQRNCCLGNESMEIKLASLANAY